MLARSAVDSKGIELKRIKIQTRNKNIPRLGEVTLGYPCPGMANGWSTDRGPFTKGEKILISLCVKRRYRDVEATVGTHVSRNGIVVYHATFAPQVGA
jgi:hypothetical protein